VERKNARGGNLVETRELAPDRRRILINLRVDAGLGEKRR
jgi:hypothetical protein